MRPYAYQVEKAQELAARVLPVSPSWQDMLRKALDLGLLTLDSQIEKPNSDTA